MQGTEFALTDTVTLSSHIRYLPIPHGQIIQDGPNLDLSFRFVHHIVAFWKRRIVAS